MTTDVCILIGHSGKYITDMLNLVDKIKINDSIFHIILVNRKMDHDIKISENIKLTETDSYGALRIISSVRPIAIIYYALWDPLLYSILHPNKIIFMDGLSVETGTTSSQKYSDMVQNILMGFFYVIFKMRYHLRYGHLKYFLKKYPSLFAHHAVSGKYYVKTKKDFVAGLPEFYTLPKNKKYKNKYAATIITQPFVEDGLWPESFFIEYFNSIKNFFISNPDRKFCIRCHPRENIDRYLSLGLPSNVDIDRDSSIDAVVSSSNAVIGINSTALIYALIRDKPLIIYDPYEMPNQFIDLNMARRVKNLKELNESLFNKKRGLFTKKADFLLCLKPDFKKISRIIFQS